MSRARITSMRDLCFVRQSGRCAYCARELGPPPKTSEKVPENSVTLDHIVPTCRGGADDLDNVVAACRRCNLLKGSMTAEEFVARINCDEPRTAAMIASAWTAGTIVRTQPMTRGQQSLVAAHAAAVIRQPCHPTQETSSVRHAEHLVAQCAALGLTRSDGVVAGMIAALLDGHEGAARGLRAAVLLVASQRGLPHIGYGASIVGAWR